MSAKVLFGLLSILLVHTTVADRHASQALAAEHTINEEPAPLVEPAPMPPAPANPAPVNPPSPAPVPSTIPGIFFRTTFLYFQITSMLKSRRPLSVVALKPSLAQAVMERKSTSSVVETQPLLQTA